MGRHRHARGQEEVIAGGLATLWRTVGPGYVIRFLGRRILRMSQHVVYRTSVRGVAAPQWPDGFVVYVVAGRDAVDSHPAIAANLQGRNVQYLKSVCQGEAIGVFVVAGDTLVHWAFVMKGSRTSCLLGLGRDAVLLGNAYTEPGFRGRGLQTLSMRQRLHECGRLGVETVYTETEPDNRYSRRAMESSGMTLVREVSLLVILNRLVFRRIHSGQASRICGIC